MTAPTKKNVETLRALGIRPETEQRLRAYVDLLARWNAKINLVGPKTLDDPWARHIIDSVQLKAHLPQNPVTLVDLGSGAGLPGLVMAILGVGEVHLIESDARKCAFLREAARVTETAITIHNLRIEAAPQVAADVVTARALAPLDELLPMVARFLKPEGRAVLLKGARWAEELTIAQKIWQMKVTDHPSITDPAARILIVEQLSRG
jgi:16S rRNA (guanine527-N7)-methyltransferase